MGGQYRGVGPKPARSRATAASVVLLVQEQELAWSRRVRIAAKPGTFSLRGM